MHLGISGTYSSGKTFTSIALSLYTGIPRTRAKTMREILPEAAPGKTLEECTSAELIQMIVVRHVDRAVHESRLPDGFISDGSSLQEWIYGSVRTIVGINPNDSIDLGDLEAAAKTPELLYFEAVMEQLGKAFKRHVSSSFDAFVHLRNELPLSADGHRPVNNRFRTLCDEKLQLEVTELGIPMHIIGGDMPTRLSAICKIFGLVPVLSLQEAIDGAVREYEEIDVRTETHRVGVQS